MSVRTPVVLLPRILDRHTVSPSAYQPLLQFAARLNPDGNGICPVVAALLPGDIPIDSVRRLLPGIRLRLGGLDLMSRDEMVNIPAFSLASAWEELLADIETMCCLLPHTIDGVQLAAYLSVRMKAACIPGVVDVDSLDGGKPLFHRLVDHGNRVARIAAQTENVVVTVDRGRLTMQENLPSIPDDTVEVKRLSWTIDRRYRLRDRSTPSADTRDLDRARVVVAVGRGLGKAENLSQVEAFAATFPGSAVAGSRGACDAGWIPPERQIGVTGKSVSPEVYVALGISGAPQHLAGMQSSRSVVSINIDPHAPIFAHSDVGIVADMGAFIAAWIDRISSIQKGKAPCP